jgi:osomolarity two-component system sensor histidine kinase NIK1
VSPSYILSALDLNVCQANRICSSLTDQVRPIAVVTTAVARGDLTQKIVISVEGEIVGYPVSYIRSTPLYPSPGTFTSMVDHLSTFASEVTRVALEVGTQGILGGQAKVDGVQGTSADLTRNVNVRFLSVCHLGVSICLYSCRRWHGI